jgi:hypothetical protein
MSSYLVENRGSFDGIAEFLGGGILTGKQEDMKTGKRQKKF